MTRTDSEILKRVEATLGKRGRKPPERDYVITCLEEMKAHEATVSRPIQCPVCHGLRVHVRDGHLQKFKDNPKVGIIEMWLRTRFSGTHWEPKDLGGSQHPPALKNIIVGNTRESDAAAAIDASNLLPKLEQMPREEALIVLDAIFVSRAYHEPERRTEKRLAAITQYFALGGSPSDVMLPEMPTPDLFDAALMLSPAEAARLAMQYKGV
jgi:hypothetical protein